MDHKIDQPAVVVSPLTSTDSSDTKHTNIHLARRGVDISDGNIDPSEIPGFDAERMRARTLLTTEEEKKLLRRIDWHIMPLCSLMFLLKNLDADNVSNARIMNSETPRNIMTQLGLSSDTYALLAIAYYVCVPKEPPEWDIKDVRGKQGELMHVCGADAVYCLRSPVEPSVEENETFDVAVEDYAYVGDSDVLSCCCYEQERDFCCEVLPWCCG
jgi:hypothetical protein